jgi:hypothetical protein
MNLIKKVSIFVIVSLLLLFNLASSLVYAANPAKQAIQCGANQAAGEACTTTPSTDQGLNNTIRNIINVLSAIVGVVAVIMIIVGGFRYITSGGDSAQIASAKNTLLYALIGLVIAALAQVIVRFVLTKVT